jgi:SHS2 domain-containing protein
MMNENDECQGRIAMTSRAIRGHEEISHTADLALRAWAEDLASLFAEAALGMNALSGMQLEPGARLSRVLEVEAVDEESLLVAFLSELLYWQEQHGLGFDEFHIEVNGSRLRAEAEGAPLLTVEKPIKAVTFHNLEIQHTRSGCEVQLVFDV